MTTLVACAPDLSELTGGAGGSAGSGDASVARDARVDARLDAPADAPTDARRDAADARSDAADARADARDAARQDSGDARVEASLEATVSELDAANIDAGEPDLPDASDLPDVAGGDPFAFDGGDYDAAACEGYALSFAGGYGLIRNPLSNDFTIEAWIKTSTTSNVGDQAWQGNAVLFADVAGPANDYTFTILNDRVAFAVGSSATVFADFNLFSTTRVVTGSWTHVAASRARLPGVLKVYVNGVLEATRDCPNAMALTGSTFASIASDQYAARTPFIGSMDELRLWNVVRTDDQIRAAMHDRLTGSEPGLVGYYAFGQPGTDMLKDTAGTNDAALSPPATWERSNRRCVTGPGDASVLDASPSAPDVSSDGPAVTSDGSRAVPDASEGGDL